MVLYVWVTSNHDNTIHKISIMGRSRGGRWVVIWRKRNSLANKFWERVSGKVALRGGESFESIYDVMMLCSFIKSIFLLINQFFI